MYIKRTTVYVVGISSYPGSNASKEKQRGTPYRVTKIGYVLPEIAEHFNYLSNVEKGLLDIFIPSTVPSQRWKQWSSIADLKRCQQCHDLHGQVYGINDVPDTLPPLHPNCRCTIESMKAVVAGTGTNEGLNGADWWIKNYGRLPDYYISRDELIKLGWRSSKPPIKYAPEKMLSGGIYQNTDGHLPDKPGRVWYEADLNYYSGRRNGHRVYWSNDGLIFVTYNHGQTYYEII